MLCGLLGVPTLNGAASSQRVLSYGCQDSCGPHGQLLPCPAPVQGRPSSLRVQWSQPPVTGEAPPGPRGLVTEVNTWPPCCQGEAHSTPTPLTAQQKLFVKDPKGRDEPWDQRSCPLGSVGGEGSTGPRQGPSRTALPELPLGAEPVKPAMWSWNLLWSALPRAHFDPLHQLTPRPVSPWGWEARAVCRPTQSSEGLGQCREAPGAWSRRRGSAKSHRVVSSKDEEGAAQTFPAHSSHPGDREGM